MPKDLLIRTTKAYVTIFLFLKQKYCICNVLLHLEEYNKVSFALIGFQRFSLIDVAFLPCLLNLNLFN